MVLTFLAGSRDPIRPAYGATGNPASVSDWPALPSRFWAPCALLAWYWAATGLVQMKARDRTYTTLLMATGLTFGSIAALRAHPPPDHSRPVQRAGHGCDLVRVRAYTHRPAWFEPDLEGPDEELEEEAGEEDLTALHHTHRRLPASRSEQPTDRVAERGGAKGRPNGGLGSRSAISSSRLYFGARPPGLAHQTSTDRSPIPAPVAIKASSVSSDLGYPAALGIAHRGRPCLGLRRQEQLSTRFDGGPAAAARHWVYDCGWYGPRHQPSLGRTG